MESQLLGLEGSSGDHPVQPPAKAVPPAAGDNGMSAGGFGMAPEDTPHHPWDMVPGLCHLQCKEVLPHAEIRLLVLHFVATAPCSVAGRH